MTSIELNTSIISALIAAALGLAGWWAAVRLRMTAPAMLGPMILVAIAAMAGLPMYSVPVWFKVAIQSIIGGYIGRRIDRSSLGAFRKMLPAVAAASTWYVAITTGLGYLVAKWAGIDLGTAFLGTAPGGVAEMTAMAISSGADVAFVATMQTLRLLVTNVTIPLLARRNADRGNPAPAAPDPAPNVPDPVPFAREDPERHWGVGLLVSLAGGLVCTAMKIPAGGVLGSMLAVAAFRLAGLRASPAPRFVLNVSYIILGVSVGTAFNSSTLARLQSSAVVLVFATLSTLAGGLVLALMVRRIMRLDFRTAMLACSPGGLSIMAVIAEETGAQPLVVSLFQLVRIVWVVLAMPVFLRLLA